MSLSNIGSLRTAKNSPRLKLKLGPVALEFASSHTGTWRIVRPSVDMEQCIACGICQKHCPTDVIVVTKRSKDEGISSVEFDFDYCKGCGMCSNVCPKKAILMISEREV